MEVAIASFKFKLLNVILDQLMDCNVIIDDYRHIAVHKLDQDYVLKLKFGQNCCTMPPLHPNGGGHCFFFQF